MAAATRHHCNPLSRRCMAVFGIFRHFRSASGSGISEEWWREGDRCQPSAPRKTATSGWPGEHHKGAIDDRLMPSTNGIPCSCLFWPSMSRRATCHKHGTGRLFTLRARYIASEGCKFRASPLRPPPAGGRYSNDQSQCNVLEDRSGSARCCFWSQAGVRGDHAPPLHDSAMVQLQILHDFEIRDKRPAWTCSFEMSAIVAAPHRHSTVHCAAGSRHESLGSIAFLMRSVSYFRVLVSGRVFRPCPVQHLSICSSRDGMQHSPPNMCAPMRGLGAVPSNVFRLGRRTPRGPYGEAADASVLLSHGVIASCRTLLLAANSRQPKQAGDEGGVGGAQWNASRSTAKRSS